MIPFNLITNSSRSMLNEIDIACVQGGNMDPDCVSLYNIAKLIGCMNSNCINSKNAFKKICTNLICKKDHSNKIENLYFDYDKNALIIEVRNSKEHDKIVINKQNKEFSVNKLETKLGKETLGYLRHYIPTVYDALAKFRECKYQTCYNIKSVNSRFLVNISNDGVSMFLESKQNKYGKDFELVSSPYNEFDIAHKCYCNSADGVNELSTLTKINVFHSVFIRIEDCPEWSRLILYEERQEELEKIRKLEKEKSHHEKRMNFKRKFLLWKKNNNK